MPSSGMWACLFLQHHRRSFWDIASCPPYFDLPAHASRRCCVTILGTVKHWESPRQRRGLPGFITSINEESPTTLPHIKALLQNTQLRERCTPQRAKQTLSSC